MDNISDLAQTCRENDNLVELSHLFQEIVNTGPFQNVEVVPMIFDFHRDDEVGLLDRLQNLWVKNLNASYPKDVP